MRPENLFQFIVPLTFLAIWALTSLFNREAQPLPPKRPEADATRPLSGSLGTPLPTNRSLELNPLAMPHSPLLGSESRNIAKTIAEPTREASRPIPVWDDFRLLLNSPAKLR